MILYYVSLGILSTTTKPAKGNYSLTRLFVKEDDGVK